MWCTRWGMVLVIPTALLVPLATLFAHNRVAVMVQLFLAMAVNSVADTSAYSGSNVIVRSSILCAVKRCVRLLAVSGPLQAMHEALIGWFCLSFRIHSVLGPT